MEASQAGQGGDAGDAGAAEQGQVQQGPDVSALAEQFGSLSQGQEEMRQILTGLQDHLAPAQEEQGLPELDLSAFDPDSADFDPNEIAQRMTGFMEQFAQQRDQQLQQTVIDPLRQQVSELQMHQQAAQLIGEFPEMGEGDTIQQVMGATKEFAQIIGAPHLAGNLQLARVLYMAGRAHEAAQGEGEESPQAAHLEGGGGAGPAGGTPDDFKAQILGGDNGGKSVLPFG